MRKALILLLAAAMLLSVLAGCASNAPAETPAESEAVSEAPAQSEAPAEQSAPAEEAPTGEEAPAEEPTVDPEETDTREKSYMESLGFISDYEAAKIAEELGIVPTTEYFPVEEGETLSCTHVYPPFVPKNLPTGDMSEKYVFQQVKELTGVNVDWIGISMMSASEDFQLLVASGDFPDILCSYGGYVRSVSYEAIIEDEIIYDLTDIIPKYCPSYNYLITNNKDVKLGGTTSKGYLPEFMGVDAGVNLYMADYIRQDWLDEMGVEVPQTYDQLHAVLEVFRDDYGCKCPMWIPDNGIDDKLMPGFGVTNTWYLTEDGSDIIYGPVQEGYRDYLTLMNQWYEEKLFSVEFMALENDFDATPTDFINNGDSGVWFQKFDSLANFDAESSGDPDFAFTPIGAMTKTEGEEITVVETGVRTYGTGMGWSITTDCENIELAARWCDFWYTEAGSMLANYGTEGYTYEYNEEGKPIWTDVIVNNPTMNFQPAVATLLLYKLGGYVSDGWKELQAYSPELIEADLAAVANQVGGQALPTAMKMTGEEETEAALYNTDIETALEENTLRFITGELDIADDNAWQTFVDTIYSLGLEKVHDIEVTVYERYLAS